MKALLLGLSLLFAANANAAFDFEKDFGFQGSSSIPPEGFPSTARIDHLKKLEQPKLNVLIFPHTLNSDWLHGPPDDATQVELNSSSTFTLKTAAQNIYSTTKAQLKFVNGGIRMTLASGRIINTTKLEVAGSAAIKVLRVRSPDKSNSYLGTFTINTDSRGIRVINHVDMETYLRGVVPKESGASWPLESLKAQALAARSYAYYHFVTAPSSRDYHVDDTARFQVYAGFSGSDPRTDEAIKQTSGEIITYQGEVIVAYFHAYSGGRTDSALNIFKQSNVPYCEGSAEIFPRQELSDELAAGSRWIVNWTTDSFTSSDLISKFKASSSVGSRFNAFSRSGELNLVEEEIQPEFDSVKFLKIIQSSTGNEAVIDFSEVRSAIGWADFPGYHFRVSEEAGSFSFKGSGWGHHVGLSQWGAYIMSKNYAKTYDEIIHHYYHDIEIENIQWSSR